MEDIKKHLFWILLGGGVLFVVILYFALVYPKGEEIQNSEWELSDFKEKLKNYSEDAAIRNEKWVKSFEKRLEELKVELRKCQDILIAKDAELEKFFKEVEKGPDGIPVKADFGSVYDDSIDKMNKEFIELKFLSPKGDRQKGFRKEEIPSADKIPLIQKRYWIQEALYRVMKSSNIRSFEGIEFGTVREGEEKFYSLIPFEAKAKIQFEDLPKIISGILQQRFLIRIKGVSVKKREMLKDYYRKDFEESERKKEIPDDSLVPEPPVFVTLSGEVIDLDQKKLVAFVAGKAK